MKSRPGALFELSFDECRARLCSPQPKTAIERPCTPGDGVEVWSEEELLEKVKMWDVDPPDAEILGLWVPASGAATRMFRPLHEKAQACEVLWSSVDELALGRAWFDAVKAKGLDPERCSPAAATAVLLTLMKEGAIPKGLVPFHMDNLGQGAETAFEAHVRSWGRLVASPKVWFTVQQDHVTEVEAHLKNSPISSVRAKLEFKVQDPATDMPVLDQEGAWLTTEDDAPFKRPGGHGALLPLLEVVSTPMFMIRNIDNAPSPARTALRERWTKALVAEARAWAEERDALLQELASNPERAAAWLQAQGVACDANNQAGLEAQMARPMRLVGVVRNEGQPGGGPFWVRVASGIDAGSVRPQIVESVEFGEDNQDVLAQATHFNPVDMVCVVKPGQSLAPFVDESRYLLAEKNVMGESAKVLEHPGLWNGGMSGWLTRFVEIPAVCFQPVKTVMDLVGRT